MLKIQNFTCENNRGFCVTDEKKPSFSFALESDEQNVSLYDAILTIGDWSTRTKEQVGIQYEGKPLTPYTTYKAHLLVLDDHGEKAETGLTFETGKMDDPWQARWITDGEYQFKEKGISPEPICFRREIETTKVVKTAKIYGTALGIYQLYLDGAKVGDRYFAPGFTSYKSQLQYQVYDVTEQLQAGKVTLDAVVTGGWAVGSFVFTRKNRVTADRQALLLELRIQYEDGTEEVIGTDDSWLVTREGSFREADFYDGETYDASIETENLTWRKAALENVTIHPELLADYSAPVKVLTELTPEFLGEVDGELIYDFKQNFAGVVHLKLDGKRGQKVTVHHAEVLNQDGSLNRTFLRTAKATATYICKDGQQEYAPTFTYMGFRYIGISGIEKEAVTPSAYVLTSEIEEIGYFQCDDERINRLQENIKWGARSNFMDIPTDCPQRDERMGWTGDIAVFSETACFNFDMTRFLRKWLRDVRSEQRSTGGIPNTVPVQGYGFPATMPVMAIDFWGDAALMVPWAIYQATGDVEVLRENYSMMKKYVKACRFWAGFGFGQNRYIWHTPATLHFGDWIAPDVPQMSQWQGRSKWTATASLFHTSKLLSQIAEILGETEDHQRYKALSHRVAGAYSHVLMDGNGKLSEEFQTGYVLPLYFGMLEKNARKNAAKNLATLVEKNDYCIGTGFPGTPYILFALADNGYEDVAMKMLFNEKCPSWLYEVKSGATTIWERWDGLDENGNCPISDDGTDMMVSYNHYASGAVGAFLYERIAGIEAIEPGYKSFRVKPLISEEMNQVKAGVRTVYGLIESQWEKSGEQVKLTVTVPVGCQCQVVLPDGREEVVYSGTYEFQC